MERETKTKKKIMKRQLNLSQVVLARHNFSLKLCMHFWPKITDVSGTISVSITAVLMGTDMVPETSVIFNQLTRLVAREDFINVSRLESFRSYVIYQFLPILFDLFN
jgi:hypothetical protein